MDSRINPMYVGDGNQHPSISTLYSPGRGRVVAGSNPGSSGIIQMSEYFTTVHRPESCYDNEQTMSALAPGEADEDTGELYGLGVEDQSMNPGPSSSQLSTEEAMEASESQPVTNLSVVQRAKRHPVRLESTKFDSMTKNIKRQKMSDVHLESSGDEEVVTKEASKSVKKRTLSTSSEEEPSKKRAKSLFHRFNLI